MQGRYFAFRKRSQKYAAAGGTGDCSGEGKIKEILKQHDKEEQRFTAEINRLSSSIKTKERELEVKEKESKEFYSTYKELFVIREKLSADAGKAENEIESFRDKMREHEREINLVSLKKC